MAVFANRCIIIKNVGFTLLEILVVVIILGILSAIAIPMFVDQSEEVEQAALYSSMRAMESAFQQYFAVNLAFPADVSRGTVPPGMEAYFERSVWSEATPVGGTWDYEGPGAYRITCGVSVVASDKSASYMAELDAKFDNGSLGSGKFRQMSSDRFTYVIQD